MRFTKEKTVPRKEYERVKNVGVELDYKIGAMQYRHKLLDIIQQKIKELPPAEVDGKWNFENAQQHIMYGKMHDFIFNNPPFEIP